MAELTTSIRPDFKVEDVDRLVVRMKEGDESAFNEVFALYNGLVYTLCIKLLADKADAMDVTQEVFLTLFRKIHSFRGECSLKTWLYRVTLNQAVNRNRWWKRRFKNHTTSLSLGLQDRTPPIQVSGTEPGPDQIVYSDEVRKAIQEGLRQLPFDQKTAVILRDVQGLPYEEIAEITSTEVGTVKSRIARGREKLRLILQEHHPGRRG